MTKLKRATLPSILMLVVSLAWQNAAIAQDVVDVSNQDCSAILESYAADPKSVPKSVADACQQAMLIAPGAGSAAAAAQPLTDPCADGSAGGSVQCWGPWATPLQPMAGPTPPGPAALVPFEEPRPELLAINGGGDDGGDNPIEEPDFPLTACDPGLPCGFATVVAGDGDAAPQRGIDAAADTQFASFGLADDGSSFTVTNDDVAIESGTELNTVYTPGQDGFENLNAGRATLIGILTGQPSELQARVVRDGEDIQIAGDFWAHNEAEGGANSGFFAWGRTVSVSDIDALIAGNAELNFAGPMSVDNSTIANLTLNYGATSTWNGNWTNPGWNFSAGGGVFGANFVSDADQFSDNVQDGFVQGALVSDGTNNAITHIIEVTLDGPGLIRDVGLVTGAGATPLP